MEDLVGATLRVEVGAALTAFPATYANSPDGLSDRVGRRLPLCSGPFHNIQIRSRAHLPFVGFEFQISRNTSTTATERRAIA